ncbi:MAG: Zn-ribbon domain-containing OB-fold protein [Bryobacteraceae bacterium]
MSNPGSGIVYTETVVYSPTPQFADEVPYQLAIVELENGRRLTGRIHGERAAVGDPVNFVEFRAEVPYFQKAS